MYLKLLVEQNFAGYSLIVGLMKGKVTRKHL